MRQQIRINGTWVVLPDDFKVTIKRTNPLFNDEGDFSFPFTLDLTTNRALIQSASDPHGRFALRMLNDLDIEYWYDGQLLFRGLTEVSDSVQFKDSISINFNAGVKTITDRVKDMSAQDVSVEHLQIGYACVGMRFAGSEKYETKSGKVSYMNLNFKNEKVKISYKDFTRLAYDTGYVNAPVKNALYTSLFNVSKDSREMPFCNTRVAMNNESENKYYVLDYNRRDAAPCMFVLAWLKRLFIDLDIAVQNEFENMEDMCRLAFFSAFPKYNIETWGSLSHPTDGAVYVDPYTEENDYYMKWSEWAAWNDFPQADLGKPYSLGTLFYHNNLSIQSENLMHSLRQEDVLTINIPAEQSYQENNNDVTEVFAFRPAFLSSEQYPDVDVQNVLDDLHDIFGLRIVYDSVTNHARVCYIKDILTDVYSTEAKKLLGEYHGDPIVTREISNGYIISYGQSNDDNTTEASAAAYDYDMPTNQKNTDGSDKLDANGDLIPEAGKVVTQSAATTVAMTCYCTDTRTYYDDQTGNAYRIMVDTESEDNNQGATPIEVGQWNDYKIGIPADVDEDDATKVTANFKPITCNDVYHSQHGVYSYTESDLVPFVEDADQTTYSGTEAYKAEYTENSDGDTETTYEEDNMMHETLSSDEEDPETMSDCYPSWGNLDTEKLAQVEWYQLTKQEVTFDDAATVTFTFAQWPNTDNLVDDQPLWQQALILTYATNNGESCDMTTDDSPLQQWQDDGNYVLGFMRGPGNDSGIEYSSEEYNSDGTRDWNTVVGNATFTADSVDQFGNVFDYNGTETGGIDQSGRLSLKLDARKVYGYDDDGNPKFYPIADEYAKRGVVAKMLEDYLHFMANRKTITHSVSIAVGELMNIDWCSFYDLQQCVGFINSVQFTLSESGVGKSTIEQYTVD